MSLVGSIASLCGGLRFAWSLLIDRYPYKIIYGILLVIQIILAFTLSFVNKSKGLFMTWICLCLFCEGGHFTLYPTMMAKIFGDYASMVYGIGMSFAGISSIFSSLLVKEFLKDLHYKFFFYISGGLSIIALLILLTLFKDQKFQPK